MDWIDEESINIIKKMAEKANGNTELEISFFPLNIKNFKKVLFEYIQKRHIDEKLVGIKTLSLDINFQYSKASTYRVSIEGMTQIDNIIKLLNTTNKNNSNEILGQLVNKTTNIIEKTKIEKHDIPDTKLRVRLSDEKKIKQSDIKNYKLDINFRYKERASLIILDNDEIRISIDITKVKSANIITDLPKVESVYELEIELKYKKNVKTKYLDKFFIEINNMLKFLQESSIYTGTTETISTITLLKQLLGITSNIKDLPGPQVVSTKILDIVDTLPKRYSITDKADGERCFLLINNEIIYLIKNNLDVIKYTDVLFDEKALKQYNNTILDGELVTKGDKTMYIAFDILYHKNTNVTSEKELEKRINLMYDVINIVFKQKNMPKKYDKPYEFSVVNEYYHKDITKFLTELNTNHKKYKNIVSVKYYIFPIGAHKCEIYAYSKIIWTLYTVEMLYPYTLDGIIYTHMQQKYVVNRSDHIQYKTLKWKPDSHNSIDFYIEYEKKPKSIMPEIAYDNTVVRQSNDYDNEVDTSSKIVNKKYKILNLFVGKSDNQVEIPVPFQKDKNNNRAYIYVDEKNNVCDLEGKIIQDKTVVEFAYNNDKAIEPQYRWIPLRTRDDKTDMVRNYRKKYGNSEMVANNIWHCITNPIEAQDIYLLADPNTYDEHIKVLNNKINKDSILQNRMDGKYYDPRHKLGETFRHFQNYVKSNLIYTYCALKTVKGKKVDVLDIGCGVGGDIMKYLHAEVNTYVGFDKDPYGIYNLVDGCIKRYTELKKTKEVLYKKMAEEMVFLVGDGSLPLNYEDQVKVIGQYVEQNKNVFSIIFGKNSTDTHKTFDILSSQFNIHYFLENETTWNNYCSNVKKFLKKDGFLLVTTFDAKSVHDSFNETGNITEYYTNNIGNKEILYDIQKKYTSDNIKQLGLPINVLMSWISDEYYTEYLVESNMLIKELKEKANLELVETNMFGSFYEMNREFLVNSTKYESINETNKWFSKTRLYYNAKDELNTSLLKYTKLTRYYIFRKV